LIAKRYKVYARLRGGMGEVYFCLDQETKQPLALKTPWHEDDDAERAARANERFLREARTWVSLGQHPNIVRCFYLDTVDDQPWLFLEWITAPDRTRTSLRDWIKERGALDLEQALRVALDLCHGLAYAATVQPNLVHRDLKPGNVLIAQDLTAKISDFGLAHRWNGLERRRPSGAGAGTPAYRPPEQWLTGDVDARADIYAVGMILYEMLMAQRPFAAQTLYDLEKAHGEEQPPSLPEPFPADVDAVIQRCMRKRPDERFQTIADLADALGALVRTHLGREPAPPPVPGILTPGDLVNRGNTFVRLKRYPDSLAEYDRALDFDPTFAMALENRGALYWMMEKPDAALADLDRAVQVNPRASGAFYNRSVVLAAQGKLQRALQDLNAALSLAPGHVDAHFNRGNLLRALGLHPQALVDYTRAAALSPRMADAYHNRGLTHVELQDYQAALADFTKAIALNSDLAASYFNRGVVYQILGEDDKALADFDAAIEAKRKFRQAYEQRGTIHHRRGNFQNALEDYTRAILLGPDERVDLYHNRGLVLTEMGEYEDAILNYDHALAVDRHYLPTHLERARALQLAGRTEEARDIAGALLAIGFESAGLHHRLHELFTALGDTESANIALDRARQVEEKYAPAAAELDQVVGAPEGTARDGSNASQEVHVAALEAFHDAATPERIQELLAAYPFMADPSFIAAAERSVSSRRKQGEGGSKRKHAADEARLLWLRTYARL
jgi:tetratricopeptide (TPR) repeat protein